MTQLKIILIPLGITVILVLAFILYGLLKSSKIQPMGGGGTSTDVMIGDKQLTQIQYDILKTDLIKKVETMNIKPLTMEETNDWVSVLNIELKKCGKWIFPDITDKNIIQQLNNKLKNKCL